MIFKSFIAGSFRNSLVRSNYSSANWITAILSNIQSTIFAILSEYLAKSTTIWENYKTESEYTNAYCYKSFLLDFINKCGH